MSFGGSKPRGPSQAELDARRKERERLEKERQQAKLQEERERNKRIRGQQAVQRRLRGRSSLIGTTELGDRSLLG